MAALAPLDRRGLAVDRDHLRRHAGQRRDPGDKTALKRLGIERGEDIAEMVMRRRAARKGPKTAQETQLPIAKIRDVRERFRPRQHRQQA
jgi:hypothetical protein